MVAAVARAAGTVEIERVGSHHPIAVDATCGCWRRPTAIWGLRQPRAPFRQVILFYRLNVFPIQLPSLRERVDDIPLLVEYLVARYAGKAGKHFSKIQMRTLELFQTY